MESIVGKILCGRYRIIQELERDEFSAVYLAEDLEQLERLPCLVEQLQPQYDREVLGARSWQKVRQKFVERANLLRKISQHPQIPQLLAFFECDREVYLVKEHIEGEALARRLTRSLISEAEAVSWLRETLEILEHVHQAGEVHLNIQPSSLLQQRDGSKFLINFASIKNAIREDNSGFANLDFTPPQSPRDSSSDLYALGKTIIYALTGRVANSIQATSAESKSPTGASTADISPELASVLNKLVGSRTVPPYQSASQALKELDLEEDVVTLPPPFFGTAYLPNPAVADRGKFDSASAKFSRVRRSLFWALLALPFAIALGLVFIGINKSSRRDLASYTNSEYQFGVKYPQTWSQRELNDPITGEIAVFVSPAESSSDLFREKVYLATEYLPSETTALEEYTQTVLQRLEQTNGSEIYDNSAVEIDGLPGRSIIYSRYQGGLQLRQMEVFTIRGDRVYIAIYTAQRDKFSKFLNEVEQIIDSWEIEEYQ